MNQPEQSASAHEGSDKLDQVLAELVTIKKQNTKLEARVIDMEKALKGMGDRLQAEEEELPAVFSPHVVATWGTMASAHMRREVRNKLSTAFNEAAIGAISENKADWLDHLKRAFETLDNILLLVNSTGLNQAHRKGLHHAVARLSALTVVRGKTARGVYEQKCFDAGFAGISAVLHHKFVKDAVDAASREEQAERSRSAAFPQQRDWRYEPYHTPSGKGKGRGKGHTGSKRSKQ